MRFEHPHELLSSAALTAGVATLGVKFREDSVLSGICTSVAGGRTTELLGANSMCGAQTIPDSLNTNTNTNTNINTGGTRPAISKAPTGNDIAKPPLAGFPPTTCSIAACISEKAIRGARMMTWSDQLLQYAMVVEGSSEWGKRIALPWE